MPRPYDYSPARRYAMQITMWLVLAATLGLAYVVSTHRARAERLDLDESESIGDVRVRLPRDWRIGEGSDDSVVAVDPNRPRQIVMLEVALPEGKKPEWALPRHGGVPSRSIRELPFPGLHRTGVMASGRGTTITEDGHLEVQQVIAAAVELAPGKALVLRIEQSGPRPDKSNEELLKRIAATVTPNPGPSIRGPQEQEPE